jgi:hypothetical protein
MPNITIVCRDCGEPFIHGTRDQAYYAENGWSDPGRCKPCRHARKATVQAPRYRGSQRPHLRGFPGYADR